MKKYESPQIELVRFSTETVLDASYQVEADETTPVMRNIFG